MPFVVSYLSRVTQPVGIRQLAWAQKIVQPLRHYTEHVFFIIVFPSGDYR
jgi:hypothetical protein